MVFCWWYYRSVSVVLDSSCFQTFTLGLITIVLLSVPQVLNTDLQYTFKTPMHILVSDNLIIVSKIYWSSLSLLCRPSNNINR